MLISLFIPGVDMKNRITLRCLVSGKVQGVWFRAHTKQEAEKLGLTGYAKNLRDGRVEVVVTGEPIKIEKLFVWLQKGPELARVEEVVKEELEERIFADFQVL